MSKFKYSKKSGSKLDTCHPLLQWIMADALHLSPYDIIIVHGHRGEELQNSLVAEGKSKTPWPTSRHNSTRDPEFEEQKNTFSDAVDFAPYVNGSIPWDDTHIFGVIAGIIMACAAVYGVKLRWGGDWNSNGSTKDQTFMDWGHVEIDWL